MARPPSAFHVALLRGVNVGGKNKLPMAELVSICAAAGCADVRNYIQSGNVVFRAGGRLAERLPALLGDAIEERFGFRPPVVVCSAVELAEVARDNPLLRAGVDVDSLHVAFLAAAPGPAAIAALDPARSPPDSFLVRGRAIFLHLPAGVARTRLTNAYFDSKLGTTSTLRNWRTVLKLLEMTGGAAPAATTR